MNVLQNHESLRLLTVVLICNLFITYNIQAEPPGFISNTNHIEVVGIDTNEASAWISGVNMGSPHYLLIDVHVRLTPNSIVGSPVSHGTNRWDWLRINDMRWPYFKATNSFCGLIELRNAEGQKQPLLRPEVNFPEAYPATFSLEFASKQLMSPIKNIYHGSPLPIPLQTTNNTLYSFYLNDYFKIEKYGEYQLIVWPKIYKRESVDSDLCRRIDVPPATLTIKWDGGSQK